MPNPDRSDLTAYWTTGAGSRPLLEQGAQPARDRAEEFFFAYLFEPLLASVVGGLLGAGVTGVAMLAGWRP